MDNIEKRVYGFTEGSLKIESRAKADGTTGDYIVGYGVVFNKPSEVMYDFIERILPTAADGVDLSKVIATINHDFSQILARVDSNTLTLTVDEVGIKYEFIAPDTTYGRDLVTNIKNGNIKGSSFMFSVAEQRWTEFENDETQPSLREIVKFSEIIEMGPVTRPAYPDTTVAKRSLDAFKSEKQNSEKQEIEKRLQRLVRKYNYNKTKR